MRLLFKVVLLSLRLEGQLSLVIGDSLFSVHGLCDITERSLAEGLYAGLFLHRKNVVA